jgi:hypothetical protein
MFRHRVLKILFGLDGERERQRERERKEQQASENCGTYPSLLYALAGILLGL